MRLLLGAVLGIIAVGVLLIAYGVLGSRPVATAPISIGARGDEYQPVQPVSERLTLRDDANWSTAPQLQLRCEPGQRAMIRQVQGALAAECVDAAAAVERVGLTPTRVSYDVSAPRAVRALQTYPAPRPLTSRAPRAPGRNWNQTALVIGGSTAAGAGLGAIFGGKTGALIGAAIGGGASSLFEARH